MNKISQIIGFDLITAMTIWLLMFMLLMYRISRNPDDKNYQISLFTKYSMPILILIILLLIIYILIS